MRVAAVDDRVAGLEQVGDLPDDVLGDRARGEHEPDRARGLEQRDELLGGRGSVAALRHERFDRLGRAVVADDAVTVLEQASCDVPAHPAEADDPELERCLSCHLALLSASILSVRHVTRRA